MEGQDFTFDLSDLANIERSCRARLAQEPTAAGVRFELAGCLLAMAMFQAGQESMLERLMHSTEVTNENLVAAVEVSLAADASQTLQDARRQVMMAHELVQDAGFAMSVARLGSILECCLPRRSTSRATDFPGEHRSGARLDRSSEFSATGLTW